MGLGEHALKSPSELMQTARMSGKQKILLVEDDVVLSETLLEQMRMHEEFLITHVETGSAALDACAREDFDLVLLDVGLPDTDGREICKIMRKQNIRAPIVMLTGADGEADTILGLEAGANDYVTKPFRFGILLARMRAHLRNHENSEAASLTIGPYRFRPALKLLEEEASGEKIRLTEKETNILKFLYRADRAPVARDVLLHEVWGYNAQVSTHTLETHIYRLRQKIEKDTAEADLLLTVDGGYSLNR